ncbi:MAG: hypothetical protein ACPGVG_05360 [Mycobacterium sp.]
MANHHGGIPPEFQKEMGDLYEAMRKRGDALVPNTSMSPATALGKVNDHPAGMYGPEDEGATQFAIGHDAQNEKVTIDFGTPVKWMAMDPEQAVHFAKALIQQAQAASRKPLVVSV